MIDAKLVFTPLSYTGWGSLSHLPEEVEKHSPKRILVVTDPVLQDIGVVEKVISPLKKQGYDTDVYTEVVPEPPIASGESLVEYIRKGGYELVIGLGGGSALDMAKAAAVLATHEGTAESYLNLSGSRELSNKGLPKILIPTTAGTGSEVTNIAVFSLESTKDVITHDYLLADAAIVDPEITMSVPAKVTAATGVDALTHAMEAYISKFASPATDALALHAIKLIGRSLAKAVKDGNDKEARSDMSHGSYIAGLAFFNAGVAGVHALAYPLGGQFHIAHGDSNAVLLPYVMSYIRRSSEARMKDMYEALGFDGRDLTAEEGSRKLIGALEALVEEVGIPKTLQGFNVPESALDSLTDDGVKQKRILARSPLTLEREDIRKIYQSAFSGTAIEA